MKNIIRRILKETLQSQLLDDTKKKMAEFESEHGDIISKYMELKSMYDKFKSLQDVHFGYVKSTDSYGRTYISAKVKLPSYTNSKKWITVYLGPLELFEDMSETEKKNFAINKISSHILNKFPIE
jgi:hypothetical protein